MAAPLDVPTLLAPPVRLRNFGLDDVPAVREAASDPLIPLITSVPAVFTDKAGQAFIERQWGRARDGEGYSFAIADDVTNKAIGQIGLWPQAHGRASIGYWIAPSARGRGAASQALRAMCQWALHEIHVPRLELYIEPHNAASIRTAERAHFVREGLLRSWQQVGAHRRDMLMYSLLRDDV